MARSRITAMRVAAVAMAAGLVLTACGSGGSAPEAASSGPVTIEFWGWAPGYDKAVAAFNASHKDIKVKYNTIASGGKGGYAKMQAAVKAGNGPCLGQVGDESIPSFVTDGTLMDITEKASPQQDKFYPVAWSGVQVGGKVYGIPMDSSPIGMFYRTDLFKKYGIKPAKTWDEYAKQAATVHAADPHKYLATYTGNDVSWLIALAQQAGAKWFDTVGDSWKVDFNDSATAKVAAYWQHLLDGKLALSENGYEPTWFNHLQDGTIASYIGPVWFAPILKDNAATSSGKWAVAPVPSWDAANPAGGNMGGSATSVLTGCKHPEQAVAAATWISTEAAGLDPIVKAAGILPAAKSGVNSPMLVEGLPFYGGQQVYKVFGAEMPTIPSTWTWGPMNSQMNSNILDQLGKVQSGGPSILDALTSAEAKMHADMKAKGLSVATG